MEISGNWLSFSLKQNMKLKWKKKCSREGKGARAPGAWDSSLGNAVSTTKGETKLRVWVVWRRQEAAHCNGTLFGARELCVNFYPIKYEFCDLFVAVVV